MMKLVGYSKIKSSKTGKEYTIVEIVRAPFSYENVVGMKSDKLFLPVDVFNNLTIDYLGKEIEAVYDLSSVRPILVDISVKDK
jgi:hypothetical protein